MKRKRVLVSIHPDGTVKTDELKDGEGPEVSIGKKCDGCGAIVGIKTDRPLRPLRDLIRILKARKAITQATTGLGWIRNKQGDFCPECQ